MGDEIKAKRLRSFAALVVFLNTGEVRRVEGPSVRERGIRSLVVELANGDRFRVEYTVSTSRDEILCRIRDRLRHGYKYDTRGREVELPRVKWPAPQPAPPAWRFGV